MLRRVVLLTATAVLCAAPTAFAKSDTRCGNGSGTVDKPYDVRALNTTCARAKQLANKHSRNIGRNDVCALAKMSCTLDGYRCRRGPLGDSTDITCKKGDKRVRFKYRA